MPAGTVRLHRVLRATPERVYRAFLDPDAMATWLPPHGSFGSLGIRRLEAKVNSSNVLLLGGAGYALGVYGYLPLGAVVDPDMRATFEAHRTGAYESR